jgi:hypothetical protein
MGNFNPNHHNNPGIACFYTAILGFEQEWKPRTALSGNVKRFDKARQGAWGHPDQSGINLYEIMPVGLEIPTVEGDIIKIGVGDRSQNQYIFHGRLKTADAAVKIRFPASEDNDWIRIKSAMEWDTRMRQARWQLLVWQYSESLQEKIRGWRFMSGIIDNLFDGQSPKYDASEVGIEEYTWHFERAADLAVAGSLMGTMWADITNRIGFEVKPNAVPQTQGYSFDPWAYTKRGNAGQ